MHQNLIFSRLNLSDVARPGQIPRMAITGREVLYQSPIVFTPLADRETVDAVKLEEIVRNEYSSAGISPSQVETGAVIITGETAKKKNADQILKALSGLAGDFVVSVAGPNVESLIAGRGAGANSVATRPILAVWRHRQRQDRGLSARRGRTAGARP